MFETSLDLPKDPIVKVVTTNNRGLTVEEVAELCLEKIVSVADTAPPVIKDQAHAFKDQNRHILVFYMRQAVKSDRTTVYNIIRDAGHPDVAEFLRRL